MAIGSPYSTDGESLARREYWAGEGLAMHRDQIGRRCLAGMERGLGSKRFVTKLHDQGFTRDAAAEAISRVFGVSRGAAELFIRSHPAWAPEPPDERSKRAETILW
jgi:hypothetical protein